MVGRERNWAASSNKWNPYIYCFFLNDDSFHTKVCRNGFNFYNMRIYQIADFSKLLITSSEALQSYRLFSTSGEPYAIL